MEEVESAIQFIDSTDRTTWISVGFGLKSEYGESAWELFDRWSSTASNYNAEVARSQWKSFKQDKGVTIKTVFHLARQAGWLPDKKYVPPTPEQLESRRMEAEARLSAEGKLIAQAQAKAAQKARWILSQCELSKHSYLDSKGFKDMSLNVWRKPDTDPLLVVPMRFNNEVCNVQLISISGEKKFLAGSRTSEVTFNLSNGGEQVWLTEGFASALSLQAILGCLKMKYTVMACFSAGNVAKMAKNHPTAIICADNDKSGVGQGVAKESGCRWFMPEHIGYDINDLLISKRLFAASQFVRNKLTQMKNTV